MSIDLHCTQLDILLSVQIGVANKQDLILILCIAAHLQITGPVV